MQHENVKSNKTPKKKAWGSGHPPAAQLSICWHSATLTHSPGSFYFLSGAALKNSSLVIWTQNIGSSEYTGASQITQKETSEKCKGFGLGFFLINFHLNTKAGVTNISKPKLSTVLQHTGQTEEVSKLEVPHC